MNQKVSYFLLATNVILIFLVIFLWWGGYNVKITISQQEFLKNYEIYKDLNGVIDSITYAQQLGRLDVISLILGMFGILIGIFAIGWFGFVRNEAKDIAKQEVNLIMASQDIKNNILNITKQTAEEVLNSNQMKQDLANRISLGSMADNNANDISISIGTESSGE